MYLRDAYPDKAQYVKGETVSIIIEFSQPSDPKHTLLLEIWCNNKTIDSIKVDLHGESILTQSLGVFTDDFMGYGVHIKLFHQDALLEARSTAFDVVKSHNSSVRYGFLSDFYENEKGDVSDVDALNKYHLNYIQFYDWMYRHEKLVPDTVKYQDMMGRQLDLEVIQEKIKACHKKNMQAIAYGAVYAASEEFYRKHENWALLSGTGEVYDFIGKLKIMSLAQDLPWHRHIIDQYRDAILSCDFDGIHMDTYGAPKWGKTKFQGAYREEYLEKQFPVLINNTRKALSDLDKPISLIFNNVGNWPVDTVAQTEQDAIYIEVWNPYNCFRDLSQIVSGAKLLSNHKPVVLAAYIKPFLKEAPERAEASALLTMATIWANGAYHLAVGEKNCILTQAYYVDYYTMRDSFTAILRKYYDFTVRYCHILYDNNLRDVSRTHCFGDNYEYKALNFRCSVDGDSGSVYTIIREKEDRKVISLINLYGNDHCWNTGKNPPPILKNLAFEICILKDVKTIYSISPENEDCGTKEISYATCVRNGNRFITFTIGVLNYWNTVVIDF